MINNKYIIKSLAPWMIDELIAFSEIITFDVIFLREQDEFYNESIERLKSNNINIYIKPYAKDNIFKKLKITIDFLFSNFFKFQFNYNSVIGLKSIWWFLLLDISIFSKKSNIHAQFATQAALVSLLIKKYYENEPKFSFTFHAYDIYFKNSWFVLLVDECHKAFSISNYNIEYVKKNYLNSDKITLCRLGVFHGSSENYNLQKNQKSKYFTIGILSWFVEKKGVEYLLKALSEFKINGVDNIKLTLAGDGPLKFKYLEFIEKNDLTDVVNYLGKIKSTQKEKFYKDIDVFVLPSISLEKDQDGIPVVLMEAISYGLPIISTNISGIPEICISNYNGYLIEERNVDELINSIVAISNNQKSREKFSKNSYSLSKEYSIVKNSMDKIKFLNWDS